MIYICEYEFETEDREDPGYSMLEVDVYGHLPATARVYGTRDHRLSLRKNLVTGNYEAFRQYNRPVVQSLGVLSGLAIMHEDTDVEEVVFMDKCLAAVVAYTNTEGRKYWGKYMGDAICQHEGKHKSSFCPGPR